MFLKKLKNDKDFSGGEEGKKGANFLLALGEMT